MRIFMLSTVSACQISTGNLADFLYIFIPSKHVEKSPSGVSVVRTGGVVAVSGVRGGA